MRAVRAPAQEEGRRAGKGQRASAETSWPAPLLLRQVSVSYMHQSIQILTV
jgi:hypothetical protein